MSKKMNPADAAARKMVKRFCHFVVDLKAIHRIGTELFANDEGQKLMDQTAPAFFTDLNDVLIKYFLLESTKITDPASSFGKYENFTIANLLETIDWPASVVCDLERLNTVVKNFRENIKEARDKLLAHYDKNTFISNAVLGEFTEGNDEKFIETLEEMCNILHKASFGEIFGDISVAMPGDVLDLKNVLKRGIAFEKLLEESKGKELAILVSYLDD